MLEKTFYHTNPQVLNTLQLGNFAAGFYCLKVNSQGQTSTIKLIKE
jgi:hypothetical protein